MASDVEAAWTALPGSFRRRLRDAWESKAEKPFVCLLNRLYDKTGDPGVDRQAVIDVIGLVKRILIGFAQGPSRGPEAQSSEAEAGIASRATATTKKRKGSDAEDAESPKRKGPRARAKGKVKPKRPLVPASGGDDIRAEEVRVFLERFHEETNDVLLDPEYDRVFGGLDLTSAAAISNILRFDDCQSIVAAWVKHAPHVICTEAECCCALHVMTLNPKHAKRIEAFKLALCNMVIDGDDIERQMALRLLVQRSICARRARERERAA